MELPKHCGALMGGFFAAAICMSLIRDLLPEKWARFVPIPMAMAIPFYIGANVAVDICIGALVKAYWHWSSPGTAEGKVRLHACMHACKPSRCHHPLQGLHSLGTLLFAWGLTH